MLVFWCKHLQLGGVGENPQKKNKYIQKKQGTEIAKEIYN